MAQRVRFKQPPVVEVACGIYFTVPAGFRTAHVGLFWNEVRDKFPKLEEAPPLFPSGGLADDLFPAVALDGFPAPRTWMICENGSALIQLQKDRLIYNWKAGPDPYPSYDAVIVEFEKHLAHFEDFLLRERLGPIESSELELTYVNHIPLECLTNDPTLLVDHVRYSDRERFLSNPSRFFWSTIYALPDEAGELQVAAQRARSIPDGRDLLKLDISARGLPAKGNSQRSWFDLAHDWITFGFADLTSARTQDAVWGRLS